MVVELRRKIVEQYPYYYTRENLFYQNDLLVAKEVFNKQAKLLKTDGAIPDGKVLERFPGGALLAEWPYKNGKLDGLARIMYESETLEAEVMYKEGEREGIVKVYYENGALKSKCLYTRDKLNGIFSHYSPDGRLLKEDLYKNGALERAGSPEAGKKAGEVTRSATATFSTGRASEISFFRQDAVIARQTLDAKGNIVSLEGNIPGGVVREYDGDGILSGEWTYRNGRPEGPAKTYYKNGNPEAEMVFKDGRRDGEVKVYYENGMLQAKAFFKDGRFISSKKFPG
ncbi:MAG: toxin-antitoxin system YwqK family antitoxin [Endomicrobiales bacterium]